MKEVFEIAEKLENKLLTLQTPEFINNFILYSIDYLNNEKRNNEVKDIFQSIHDLYAEWDGSLRKLLGLNVLPAEKQVIFIQIRERIKEFASKNNITVLTASLNNTPYSPLKSKMYEPQCKKYITTVRALVTEYKNIFTTNYESLTPSEIVRRKKRTIKEEEPDLLSRIHQDNKKYFENICQALSKSENFKNLVNYSLSNDTYTWNLEKRGNILIFVAFAQALKEKQITQPFNSPAHRCRAFCTYFNIERDIEKQFGDKGIKNCKKFIPQFIDIINNVIKGNKLRDD